MIATRKEDDDGYNEVDNETTSSALDGEDAGGSVGGSEETQDGD